MIEYCSGKGYIDNNNACDIELTADVVLKAKND